MHTILYSNTKHSETYTKFKDEDVDYPSIFLPLSKGKKRHFWPKKNFPAKFVLSLRPPVTHYLERRAKSLDGLLVRGTKRLGFNQNCILTKSFSKLSIFSQKYKLQYFALKMTKIVTTDVELILLGTYFFFRELPNGSKFRKFGVGCQGQHTINLFASDTPCCFATSEKDVGSKPILQQHQCDDNMLILFA
jgi:hypothetical protein